MNVAHADKAAKWWLHHVKHTREYVNGVFNKKPAQAQVALKELTDGVAQWGQIVGNPNAVKLMKEHTLLAKALADKAAANATPTETNGIVAKLLQNARLQAEFYDSIYNDFPKDTWSDLFKDHIKSTGEYILAAARGDMNAFNREWVKTSKNAQELAAFSAHAFKWSAPKDVQPVNYQPTAEVVDRPILGEDTEEAGIDLEEIGRDRGDEYDQAGDVF